MTGSFHLKHRGKGRNPRVVCRVSKRERRKSHKRMGRRMEDGRVLGTFNLFLSRNEKSGFANEGDGFFLLRDRCDVLLVTVMVITHEYRCKDWFHDLT